MEYSVKHNQSTRELAYLLLTGQAPFLSILNLEGVFLGNIWLSSFSKLNVDIDFSDSIEMLIDKYPALLEISHFITFDEDYDKRDLESYKETIIPVIDKNKVYLGYINQKQVCYYKFQKKLNMMSSDKLLNILIVDDEVHLLNSLSEILEDSGYRCILAKNGREALEKLNAHTNIQLILTDIKMPEMDGKEFIQQVRENNFKIPIIVLSAFGTNEEVIDCLKLGANDFLNKPFTIDLLEHSIKKREKVIKLDARERNLAKIQSILSQAGIILSDSSEVLHEKLNSLVVEISKSLDCRVVSFITKEIDSWNILASTNNKIHTKRIPFEDAPILENVLEKPRVLITSSIEELSIFRAAGENNYLSNSSMIFPIFRNGFLYALLCCSDKNGRLNFDRSDSFIANSIINPLSYLIDYAFIQNELSNLNKNLKDEAKQMAKEIIELEKESEFNSRLALIGETASSIAHDIKNPLTIAMGNIEAINKKFDICEDMEKRLSKVHLALSSISRITNSITKLSHYSLEEGSFELKETIENSLVMIESKLKEHSIELKVNDFKNCIVNGNQIQIEQVIINLVSNAIDAIKDQVTKRIYIDVTLESSNSIKISILDNGPGIPLEVEKNIFNKWFTTKKIGEGTGLGLHICKKIIEAHLSELKYRQTEQGLSEFSFSLCLSCESS